MKLQDWWNTLDTLLTQDQLRQVFYGIRKGDLPIKFTYLTELGSQAWEHIESERVKTGEFSMDTKLFESSIESYLEELCNPTEIQIIDIGGWYGHTARSLLEILKQKWIWSHYHTIDISSILLNACQKTVSDSTISQSWHLLDLDDGWIGRKIREIKEQHPRLPILITFLGNTIWNFVAPQEIVRQIYTGMDIDDRLILWAHLFKERDEKRIIQEYNINTNPNIRHMISSVFQILGVEKDSLQSSITWNPQNTSVRGYIEITKATTISIQEHTINLPQWYSAEVLQSTKFTLGSLLSLAGTSRVALIKTDTRWLYSQIMLASNSA